jgi:hypothetical protein
VPRIPQGMTTATLLLGLSVLVAAAYAQQPPQPTAQKPISVISMHAENRSRAQTLDDLWKDSAIVIEGVIVSQRPVDLVRSGTVTPHTSFDVRILEVFKGDARVTAPGGEVAVRRIGGDRDRGDHIERFVPDDYPQFQVGERYILFLSEHILPNEVFYSTANVSAEGVFKIIGPGIESRGRRPIALQLANMGPDSFRQALRDKKGRQ